MQCARAGAGAGVAWRLRRPLLLPSLSLACMAALPPAAAAAAARAAKRPERVQQVLRFLLQHPMTVTSTPMQYDAEPTVPLPAVIQGLSPADVLPGGGNSSGGSTAAHMARVIAGLLYVAVGGLDAAHNLVTPLCWGSWTPYSGVCWGWVLGGRAPRFWAAAARGLARLTRVP